MGKPYPLLCQPLFVQRIWGGRRLARALGKKLPPDVLIGESWEVADLPAGSSTIANGPLKGRPLGDAVTEWGAALVGTAWPAGRFPLLVKLLDAQEDLSVQVHPSDEDCARDFPQHQGKDESWIVLQARRGGRIIHGARPGADWPTLAAAVQDETVLRRLRQVPVQAGDVIRVAPGCIHALGRGVMVLEIQQPSDTTFRIFDYGRGRTVHLDEAARAVRFDEAPSHVTPVTTDYGWGRHELLVDAPAYRIERLTCTTGLSWSPDPRTVQVAVVLNGRGQLAWSGQKLPLQAGDTVIIPAGLAEVTFRPFGEATVVMSSAGGLTGATWLERARLSCLKAYDFRGVVGGDLDEALVYRIGLAASTVLRAGGPVAVGHDVRPSSPAFAAALARGLNDGGVATRSLGQCGTEMVYHAAAREGLAGGIMITASHNPAGDNGLKLVGKDPARNVILPVTDETGLLEIERRVRLLDLPAPVATPATDQAEEVTDDYLQRVLGFVSDVTLKPFRVVVNAGNGCAGPLLDRLERELPFELIKICHEPDATFPNGVPNPLLPENRALTRRAVKLHGADFGVAWDGDFDRCFLFDERGRFIEGYYIVGLLAERLLRRHGGGRIVHDPRLYWNTHELVAQHGGAAVKCRTGHARIKALMVEWDCLYGGEMSAHHYFRDFAYCDTGMVPWLLVAAVMSETGQPLSTLVSERMRRYPCSGEINSIVEDPHGARLRVLEQYAAEQPTVDFFDGLSMTFANWRLNLRQSDTQPELLRLNVEARGRGARRLVAKKTAEILDLLNPKPAATG